MAAKPRPKHRTSLVLMMIRARSATIRDMHVDTLARIIDETTSDLMSVGRYLPHAANYAGQLSVWASALDTLDQPFDGINTFEFFHRVLTVRKWLGEEHDKIVGGRAWVSHRQDPIRHAMNVAYVDGQLTALADVESYFALRLDAYKGDIIDDLSVPSGIDWPDVLAELEAAPWSGTTPVEARYIVLADGTSMDTISEERMARSEWEASERGLAIETHPDGDVVLVQTRPSPCEVSLP